MEAEYALDITRSPKWRKGPQHIDALSQNCKEKVLRESRHFSRVYADNPRETLLQLEHDEAVNKIVSALPARSQAIISLLVQGRSSSDILQRMNMSSSSFYAEVGRLAEHINIELDKQFG